MEKVSVIIPVYNKKKYIGQCIESVIKQSYGDIEIIIIDDGSTDGSIEIEKTFANQDNRIHLLTTENHGVAHARNIGLESATGEYVVFVDADDYVCTDYIERLCEEKTHDLVVTGYKQLEDDRWTSFSCGTKLAQGRLEIEKNYFNKMILPYMVMPVVKLFRRDLIEEYNIRFVDISWGEDADFVLQYLKYCNSVKFIDNQGYINRIVPGTLSRKKVKNMWKMAQMVMHRCEDVFTDRKTGWQFFYIRFVKCCLVNSLDDWREFRDVCNKIKKDRLTETKLWRCESINDFFTIMCLKMNLIRFIYKLMIIRK